MCTAYRPERGLSWIYVKTAKLIYFALSILKNLLFKTVVQFDAFAAEHNCITTNTIYRLFFTIRPQISSEPFVISLQCQSFLPDKH